MVHDLSLKTHRDMIGLTFVRLIASTCAVNMDRTALHRVECLGLSMSRIAFKKGINISITFLLRQVFSIVHAGRGGYSSSALDTRDARL